jgi:hypothetical protein
MDTTHRKKDWPATLIYQRQIAPGKLQDCTSTIIGDHALITAAHCLFNSGRTVVLLSNKIIDIACIIPLTFSLSACAVSSATRTKTVNCADDVAICHPADGTIVFPLMARERIMVDNKLSIGSTVTILGFGCTQEGEDPPLDLKYGFARIVYVPDGSVQPGNPLKSYIEAEAVGSTAATACAGDSGGAAHSSIDPAKRVIWGIVSRGSVSSGTFFVDLNGDKIRNFFNRPDVHKWLN